MDSPRFWSPPASLPPVLEVQMVRIVCLISWQEMLIRW
jgi:hypothetical protein